MADIVPRPTPRTLEELVDEAAEQITRLTPRHAHAAAEAGGLIIDIRAQDARARDGIVPGSLHIPRTVLEWRIATESPWRNPFLGGLDQQLVLICDHGYSSVLAAANLVRLGFERSGDVIGGFQSWVAHGLPVTPSRPGHDADPLPGMGPPD